MIAIIVPSIRQKPKKNEKVSISLKLSKRIAIPEARETMEQDKQKGSTAKKEVKEKGRRATVNQRVPTLTAQSQENEEDSEEESLEDELYLNTKDLDKLKAEVLEVKVYAEKCVSKMKEELYITATR